MVVQAGHPAANLWAAPVPRRPPAIAALRPIAWLAGTILAIYVLGSAFHSEPLFNHPTIANPIAIDAARPLLRVVQPLGAALLPVVVVCSAASILVRFRRARGLERQQLKWLPMR
jgi:hypothetical protein